MSDWQVGDLAVCINVGRDPNSPGSRPPQLIAEGHSYSVCDVFTYAGQMMLKLEGLPDRFDTLSGGYCDWRFRKIRPDEHDACEPEFVTLLKRGRKTVRA